MSLRHAVHGIERARVVGHMAIKDVAIEPRLQRSATRHVVAEEVLDEAAFQAEDEDDDEADDEDEEAEEVVEQFKEFIDNVSPEDFAS